MTGRGRGSDEGEGAAIGVSERSLFANPVPMPTVPAAEHVSRPGGLPLPADFDAPVAAIRTGAVVRWRRHFGRLSWPGIKAAVASAVTLELDRGITFLLVPVFLASGVIVYFSLATETGFGQPIATVALMALCAIVFAVPAQNAFVFHGRVALRLWSARGQGRDLAGWNPDVGLGNRHPNNG